MLIILCRQRVWMVAHVSCFRCAATKRWIQCLALVSWLVYVSHWTWAVYVRQDFLNCDSSRTSSFSDDLGYLLVSFVVFIPWTDIVPFAQIVEFNSGFFLTVDHFRRSSLFLDLFYELDCRGRRLLIEYRLLGFIYNESFLRNGGCFWDRSAKVWDVKVVWVLSLNALVGVTLQNALNFSW